MYSEKKRPIRILYLSKMTSSNSGVRLHSLSSSTPWLCLLCAAMLWVRRVWRDCVPQRGLSALWLPFAALHTLPPPHPLPWGARRAQLATENSPFSWTHTPTHSHTHSHRASVLLIAVHGQISHCKHHFLWLWNSIAVWWCHMCCQPWLLGLPGASFNQSFSLCSFSSLF